MLAIEAISSPDGRIFGKTAHCDRTGKCVLQNIPGDMDEKIFASGVGTSRKHRFFVLIYGKD
jgi:phosphoribosylformylglycinamidine synthase